MYRKRNQLDRISSLAVSSLCLLSLRHFRESVQVHPGLTPGALILVQPSSVVPIVSRTARSWRTFTRSVRPTVGRATIHDCSKEGKCT